MISLAAVLAASLVTPARAQQAAPAQQQQQQQSPSMAQLQLAAQGGNVYDGSVKRRDGALEILSEQKGVVISREQIPAHRECDVDGAEAGDYPHARPVRMCFTAPSETDTKVGDIQTVRIYDRSAYVRAKEQKGNLIGAGIGAAIGALGFLALLAGPIGWAVGFSSLVVGAMIGSIVGAKVAKDKASNDPDVFERVVNEHTVVTRP